MCKQKDMTEQGFTRICLFLDTTHIIIPAGLCHIWSGLCIVTGEKNTSYKVEKIHSTASEIEGTSHNRSLLLCNYRSYFIGED